MGHEFDRYASDYDAALNQGLKLTGESRDFYAQRRVTITRDLCQRFAVKPRRVLDFGCGTGATLPLLRTAFPDAEIIGLEPSAASRAIAERDTGLRCYAGDELPADFRADLIYCNGVFHHIPPAERLAALRIIARALAPEGVFCLWENNPANPGTRWVMSRIPFDRDAVTLWPREARALGGAVNWRVLATSFHFYFPKALQRLRSLERFLVRIPLGGQYLVVFRPARR